MTEERNTVYIPTWMDTSIPGLRNPYDRKYIGASFGDAEKVRAARIMWEWTRGVDVPDLYVST